MKRFSFDVLDSEVLHATVDPEAYPTVVVAEAAELDKWVSNLHCILAISTWQTCCADCMCCPYVRLAHKGQFCVPCGGGGGGG